MATRVVVVDHPFQGFFQSLEYTYFERRHGLTSLVPVTEVEVKSQIARPGRGERIPRDSHIELLNHTRDFAPTLGAFLPLRVGGVCGADGE